MIFLRFSQNSPVSSTQASAIGEGENGADKRPAGQAAQVRRVGHGEAEQVHHAEQAKHQPDEHKQHNRRRGGQRSPARAEPCGDPGKTEQAVDHAGEAAEQAEAGHLVLGGVGGNGGDQKQPGHVQAAQRALNAPGQLPAPQGIEGDLRNTSIGCERRAKD